MLAGLTVFQKRSGRIGDVSRVGSSAEVGDEYRKVFRGGMAEAVTQVGVIHVIFDHAECDSGVAPNNDRLADRIARDA